MTYFTKTLLSVFFLSGSSLAIGQGIKGTITADDGSPLGYTTIYVKQTGTGTTSIENGYFELPLRPGQYELVFQYLGYETIVRQVTVENDFVEINITMRAQVTMLRDVVVEAGKEDPAYTIMRKAIAKANYHRQQLDSYSARVYIKGVGQLKDYPWLAKKALEKEGIEKDRVFISESVSEIKYKRPNTFEEKVISIRSDGKDNNTSPNQFIFGSFYEPEVAETVTPLSPRAFSYYRFEYQGTFKDRDYEVSRIKVTPRSKGDNVVSGMLYIVENWWSIHSFDLYTTKLGIKIQMKSVFAPIEDKAWLPVSHQFDVAGKFFGFEFVYKYLASVSDYKIEVNPEVYVEPALMEVVDEKLEKERAEVVETKFGKETKELQKRLEDGQEITRKELRKIVKEYEKAEQKEEKEPEVISNTSFKIDSLAYKKDSVHWALMRPIPLTDIEIMGYHKSDSLAEVERKKEAGDTTKQSKHKGFQPWDIVLGDSYKTGKHSNFRIHTPVPNFNSVEGFNFFYKLSYGIILQDTNKTRLLVSPVFRYAFSRKAASGNLKFSMRNKNYRFELEGGRYVDQYNIDNPIWPIVNSFTTLFLEKNLMKIYERDYVDALYRYRFSPYLTVETDWSWMRRYELMNNTDWTLINNKNVEGYTDNRPVNAELADTGFDPHNAFIGSVSLTARPWLKFRIRNGNKYEISNSSPVLSFKYRKGFNSIFDSDVDFDQIELGFKHSFKIGVRGKIDFATKAGMFLNSDKLYFMDYKHFLGNLTPFSTNDPVGSFRLLDYYEHSTADQYLTANAHYKFRKFLVTNFMYVRMLGIQENIFVNYLASPTSKNYTEVGYSIDGILRIFRLEAAAAFQDGKYLNYGIRIGIATNIGVNFED